MVYIIKRENVDIGILNISLAFELAIKLVVHCDKDLEIGQTQAGIRHVVPITGESWARYTLQAMMVLSSQS